MNKTRNVAVGLVAIVMLVTLASMAYANRYETLSVGTITAETSVTSPSFVGDLTGDVTGDVTGSVDSTTGAFTNATTHTKHVFGTSTTTVVNNTGITSSGSITATGGFVGDVTGDVVGDVTGDVDGTLGVFVNASATNFYGALTGNVTGNVTGNADGTLGVFTNATTHTRHIFGTTTGVTINNTGVTTTGSVSTTTLIVNGVTFTNQSTEEGFVLKKL